MDNKFYKISQTDFDALIKIPGARNILTHAEIVDVNGMPVVDTVGQNMSCRHKENLTCDKMRELFGANYSGLVYFNFDTRRWNKTKYQNDDLHRHNIPCVEDVYAWKSELEQEETFRDYELVASVVMAVSNKGFPGWAKPVRRPVFDEKGTSAVGTIVRRSRKTGKILSVPSNWVGLFAFNNWHGAMWRGASYGARDQKYHQAILEFACRKK